MKNIKKIFTTMVAFGLLYSFSFAASVSVDTDQAGQALQQAGQKGVSDLVKPFLLNVGKIMLAIFIIFILLGVSKSIANKVKNKIKLNSSVEDDEYSDKLSNLVGDILYYLFAVFSIFLGLQFVGYDVAVIMGGITFGIGFAFQSILSNMISGILIITTKEFKLGDIIDIDSGAFFGRIEEISIRYTVIRTFDMRRVIIPNTTMINSPIKTFSSEEFVRNEVTIGVHYDSDLEKVQELMKTAINSFDFVTKKESTSVLVTEFADSSINLIGYYYLDPNAGVAGPYAASEIRKAMNDAFADNNINIPYPHTVVTVDKNDSNLLKSAAWIMNSKK